MECPFFEEKTFRYCRALAKRIMIPSRTEKERFCGCEDYQECPIYKEWMETKEKGSRKLKTKDG